MDSVLISGPPYNVKYLLRTCNAYKLVLGFKSGKQMKRIYSCPCFHILPMLDMVILILGIFSSVSFISFRDHVNLVLMQLSYVENLF